MAITKLVKISDSSNPQTISVGGLFPYPDPGGVWEVQMIEPCGNGYLIYGSKAPGGPSTILSKIPYGGFIEVF